jgi:hypothetical protein
VIVSHRLRTGCEPGLKTACEAVTDTTLVRSLLWLSVQVRV